MATEAGTLKELIKTLEDGRDGFAKAAKRLEGDSAPDVSVRFREFSAQRGAMADALRTYGESKGYNEPDSGTVAGAVHRGWIAVKDALTGDDPTAVIAAAEQGEDHAKSKFNDALSDSSLSPEARSLVQQAAQQVKAAHDYVSSLKKAAKAR
jgi:uncharacterized protein (TIGR02284 family)